MFEIEFRGWHIAKEDEPGEWVYGYFFKHPDGSSAIFTPGKGSFIVDPNSVGQYVGMVDVFSNKIFTGDILFVEWNISNNPHFASIYEVYFNEKNKCFMMMLAKDNPDSFIPEYKNFGDSDSVYRIIGNHVIIL